MEKLQSIIVDKETILYKNFIKTLGKFRSLPSSLYHSPSPPKLPPPSRLHYSLSTWKHLEEAVSRGRNLIKLRRGRRKGNVALDRGGWVFPL